MHVWGVMVWIRRQKIGQRFEFHLGWFASAINSSQHVMGAHVVSCAVVSASHVISHFGLITTQCGRLLFFHFTDKWRLTASTWKSWNLNLDPKQLSTGAPASLPRTWWALGMDVEWWISQTVWPCCQATPPFWASVSPTAKLRSVALR